MIYNARGNIQVTTDAGYGLYSADGYIRITIVDGNSLTGLYAADGSWNAVLVDDTDTPVSIYHPCGAIRVVETVAQTGSTAPNGALYVSGAGTPLPVIVLTGDEIPEDAGVGDTVGTLTISGTYTGTPVFALDDDANGLFVLDGDDIEVAGALDYETADEHTVTVSVSGIDPVIDPQDFVVTVTNVTAASAAGILLDANGDIGLAIVASDDSMVIRDFATPVNDYSGAPGPKLTTSRGSSAAYHDSSNVLQIASSNVLRRDFDPRLGSSVAGYLSEGARTNLVLRSAAIDNASWTKVANTITADNTTGPDGLTAADLCTDGSSGFNPSITQDVTVSSGATGVQSLYIKRGNNDWIRFVITNTAGTNVVRGWLNTATGALGTVQVVGTGTGQVLQVIAYPNGWYRLLLTGALTGETTYRIQFNSATGDTSGTRVTGATYYLWGVGFEVGGFASSPIATAGSTVARSADSITLATSAFPWSATVGTLMFEGHTPLGSGTQVLWQCDDGSENERFRLLRNSSNEIHFIVTDGGSGVCDLNLGTVANDTAFKVAVSWAANDFVGSLNGGTAVTDTSGTLPTVTTMRLGSSFTGEQSFAHCKRIMYLPLNKSSAQIEALAT